MSLTKKDLSAISQLLDEKLEQKLEEKLESTMTYGSISECIRSRCQIIPYHFIQTLPHWQGF
ncbi:MAG: hypothetical protein Q4C61_15360, partial [Lachnospiraceae bacterium]|nr:hypothetical protein [Lachnospiraceae bacterium]